MAKSQQSQPVAQSRHSRPDPHHDRLCQIETALAKLVVQSDSNHKLLKEIRKHMATQADVDAVTAQLDEIKTSVGAQGVEIAKIGSDLTAFIANNPSVSIDALKAKATEVGNAIASAGAALQAVDDQLPEQTPPA